MADHTPSGRNPNKEKEQKKDGHGVSQAQMYFLIGMFVFVGTSSTIVSKIMYQTKSIGRFGQSENFSKPLFQNLGMFAGMSGCLLLHEYNNYKNRAENQHLLAGPVGGEPKPKSSSRIYYIVMIPAFCDFLATYLMNIGLLWINASIWQMVRGSIIFFTAGIRLKYLHQNIRNYQWFGVSLVMAALIVIGVACIESGSSEAESSTPFEKGMGVLLVFLAQFVQAIQTVVEEKLLKNENAAPLQVVGLEGLWGLFLTVCVAMPFAQYVEIEGLAEDSWDSFAMVYNSTKCQILTVIYVAVILGYNLLGMQITQYLNAVTRNVFDSVRTMLIWFVLTMVHYFVSPFYGEAWTTWSWMQLFGFAILIAGVFTYNHVIELPYFDYEPLAGETPQVVAKGTPRLTPRRKAKMKNSPGGSFIPASPHR